MSELYIWGANSHGQLALGYESEMCSRPVRLPAADLPANLHVPDIRQICGGGTHLLLLVDEGRAATTTSTKSTKIFACGWNNRGQLGVRTATMSSSRLTAIDAHHFGVDGDSDRCNPVCAVRAGWDCSAAITANGDVYLWGSNAFEQLGVTKEQLQHTATPRKLRLPAGAGPCIDVQFGLRTTVFVTAAALYIIAVQRRRTSLLDGARAHGHRAETLLDPETGVTYVIVHVAAKNVACGTGHVTFVLDSDSHATYVQAIGDNKYGQCDRTPPIQCDAIRLLRSGWAHSAVLTAAAEVWLWGRNDYGELGRSLDSTTEAGPIRLPAVTEGTDGGVVDVQLGAEHGIVRRANGDVCTWGWNEHGNCGNGSEVNVFEAVRVELPGPSWLVGAGSGFCAAVVECDTRS